MTEKLVPLAGHAVFLLFIQLALLLVVARLGAELAKRVSLPAVVGELAAGIALGPTVFGHFVPGAFEALFPHVSAQFHLLEVVGTLGMALLLLLTGMETDLRLLRTLGRPAAVASGTGMALPFVLGFGLGWVLPGEYLANPDHRVLFSLFMATAMSISAMPVIAKILMDLNLTRRNIGLVILSAGVVDDTAGWLVLSLIAGISHGGGGLEQVGILVRTVGLTAAFLALMAFVVFPLTKVLFRVADRFRTRDADLVVILVITFLAAAATEWIGIHAVFGAFIAGCMFKQVPQLRAETVHRLEWFVFAVLAPVFFGIVGLKVDLWRLPGWNVFWLVLAVACSGKLIGCTVGGVWGGLRFWEALSIAVAMNARGAMELVVATIGLSLGILNDASFSVIVMIAVVTSFMAPLGLRLTMRMVRMTDEEARRIEHEQVKGILDPEKLRVLVPTAGGPNALGAARLAFAVAKKSASPVTVLFVEEEMSWWDRLRRKLTPTPAGMGLDAHFAALKTLGDGAPAPELKRVNARDVADAIIGEAKRDYDLVMMGATQRGLNLGGDILEEVVAGAPCHVAVVRGGAQVAARHLLVPIDGSVASRVAAEFAARVAEPSGAELTLAILTEQRPQVAAYSDETGSGADVAVAAVPEEEINRVSAVFRAWQKKPKVLRFDYDPTHSALLQAVARGPYDLVVIGAENRAIQNRMYFGYDAERLIRDATVPVVVIIPNVARIH